MATCSLSVSFGIFSIVSRAFTTVLPHAGHSAFIYGWQVFGSLSSGMEQVSRSSALPHQGSRDNLVQQAALRHTLRRGSKKMFQVQGLHDELLAMMTDG